MNKMTVTKVRTGQENTNPAITTLVYREKSYPAREVQGKDGELYGFRRKAGTGTAGWHQKPRPGSFRAGREHSLLLHGRGNPHTAGRRTGRNDLRLTSKKQWL